MDNDETVENLKRTLLHVGGRDLVVTQEDAKAIRAALLEWLRQSDREDRENLVRWTQGPAWIDPDGTVRVGPWLLGAEGSGLVLRYREKERLHTAAVSRDGGAWTIGRVTTE
jgi:streptomycin 6-kinase